jgi:carboxypeptidase Taq
VTLHAKILLENVILASNGLFGYFPTYTLGNLVSAIIASKMRKDLEGYEEDIKRGNFNPIREGRSIRNIRYDLL